MTHHQSLGVFVFALALMTSCGGSDDLPSWWVTINDGGPSEDAVDETSPPPPDGAPLCDLPFSRLRVDIGNCGGCGHLCDLDNADRCLSGTCSCGLMGGPCDPGQDCRAGVCLSPDPSGVVCEFDGDCQPLSGGPGAWYCIQSQCTWAECVEEVCDGVDNDCDGDTDETSEGLPLSRWCPTSYDFLTLEPPCEAGVQFCRSGSWTPCVGENLPVHETGTLACDGVDNDCDGCVDGTLPGCVPIVNRDYDVVFVLDMSGSMVEEQEAVLDAMTMFAERFSRPEFRYALVLMPGPPVPGSGIFSPWWSTLALDLSDYTTFVDTLTGYVGLVTGDVEPSWDTIAYLGEEDVLLPSWSATATRVLIMITDEDGQSVRALHGSGLPDSPSPVNEMEMCASLNHGEVLAVVNDTFFWSWFDLCAQMFDLTSDAVEMAESLSTIISDPCQE